MRVYAISDLHLSFAQPKPMDIFGAKWAGYEERLCENWRRLVDADDLVLIAGDISWAMQFRQAMPDLEWIDALPGKKVLLRGNHDYWWTSISTMRAAFPSSIYAVQNDCLRFGDILVCGTRGWTVSDGKSVSAEDTKIYARELERLKLTLAAAKQERREADRLLVMMHYPPFNARREFSEFVEQITTVNPSAVIYGHLHGNSGRRDAVVTMNEIPYYLTSLDAIDATPVLILEES